MVTAWWTFLLPLLELPTWKTLSCGVSAVQPWTPRVTGRTCWGPFPQPADPVILQPQDLKAVTVLYLQTPLVSGSVGPQDFLDRPPRDTDVLRPEVTSQDMAEDLGDKEPCCVVGRS